MPVSRRSAGKIKFVNNLLVIVNTAAIAEAIALGLRVGVDSDMMIEDRGGHRLRRLLFSIPEQNVGPPSGPMRNCARVSLQNRMRVYGQ
jgi:hypothetical protein